VLVSQFDRCMNTDQQGASIEAIILCFLDFCQMTFAKGQIIRNISIITRKIGNFEAYCNLRPLDVALAGVRFNYEAHIKFEVGQYICS